MVCNDSKISMEKAAVNSFSSPCAPGIPLPRQMLVGTFIFLASHFEAIRNGTIQFPNIQGVRKGLCALSPPRLPSPLVVPDLVMFIGISFSRTLAELDVNVRFADPDHEQPW